MHFKIITVFVTLALFGLAMSTDLTLKVRKCFLEGKCTNESKYRCTECAFYKVKQCLKSQDKCDCVHAWDGGLHKKVDKNQDCPPCLLANAAGYKKTAEGYMDINMYTCDSEGYYDTEPQCMWYGTCYCYTKDGEVKKTFQYGADKEQTCDDE